MVNENLKPAAPAAAAEIASILEKAHACHRAGRLEEAETHYRAVLSAEAEHAEALHMLGVLANARGEVDAALALIRRALAADPLHSTAHYNLAKMLEQQGQLDEAAEAYRRTLALRPNFLTAYTGLAAILRGRGRLDAAAATYRALLAAYPDYLDGLVALGALLEEMNRLDEAAEVLRRALALAPDHVAALNNLGNVLQRLGRPEEAASCLRQALEADPGNPDIEANLGNALQKQGLIEEAATRFASALDKRPSPGLRLRAALTLPVIPESTDQMAAARAELEATLDQLLDARITIEDPFREVGVTSFYLAYQGLDDRAVQAKLARILLGACPDLGWTAPHCRESTRRGGRIRLGFVSHHLRDHTIGKLNRGLIAQLDRSQFEVIVFSTHSHADDEIAVEIGRHAAQTVALPQRLGPARARVAEAGLDVLYYPDIGMDPFTYFLAFARLAPLQCTTWGHPLTTGIPNLDVFFSAAPAEIADAERHYSERLVRLSVMSNYIYRPAPAGRPKTRADFGLDSRRHLYLCPQSLFKLHPDFDRILGQILCRDPAGEVLLIEAPTGHWTESLERRLDRGLADVRRRIRLLPRMSESDFLGLIATSEVVLDTSHFCGGHTSYEALAMGTPVVTLPSPLLRARLTTGMYKQMGIDEPIAADPQAYVEIALGLGTEPDARAALAARIAERRHVLFENHRAVREHEDFFVENLR